MCEHDGPVPIHDRGLGFDLETLQTQQQRQQVQRHRRAVLGLIGAGVGAGVAAAAGGVLLGGSSSAAAAAACSSTEIPGETAGPYPGDGSNGPDVLEQAGVVRRDLRRSFGDSTTKAPGVKLTFTLTLKDTSPCRPLKGLAVYAWHCNAAGGYSMYSDGIEDENYLRGVQVSGKKGKVTFVTTFPGCYSGRWPHIHFEVYPSKRAATNGGTILATSQLALPRQQCLAVYRNHTAYAGSETNLNQISLRSDNVFGDDGGARQLATMSGSVAKGYRARLLVPVDR